MQVENNVVKSKTELARRSRQELKVVAVELVPTPGAQQRLAKVFELLLAPNLEGSQSTVDDEATSQGTSEA